MQTEQSNGKSAGFELAFDCKAVEKVIREDREQGIAGELTARALNDSGMYDPNDKPWTGSAVSKYAVEVMKLPRLRLRGSMKPGMVQQLPLKPAPEKDDAADRALIEAIRDLIATKMSWTSKAKFVSLAVKEWEAVNG